MPPPLWGGIAGTLWHPHRDWFARAAVTDPHNRRGAEFPDQLVRYGEGLGELEGVTTLARGLTLKRDQLIVK